MVFIRSAIAVLLCIFLPTVQLFSQTSGQAPSQTGVPQSSPQAQENQQQNPPISAATLQYALNLTHSKSQEDLEKAYSIFATAAQQDNVMAAQQIAWMELNGVGVQRSPKYAVTWLNWLVQKGDTWAMTALGGCYRRGDGVPWDEGQAMKLFYAAHQRSHDAEAESELGRGYLHGFGPDTTDYPAAIQWFQLAARQGYEPAELQLGYMFQRGWGTAVNKSAARNLFQAVERSPDPQMRKTALEMDRSLDQEDQASSGDGAILALLGIAVVAALASSTSSDNAKTTSKTYSASDSASDFYADQRKAADEWAQQERERREREQREYEDEQRRRNQQEEQRRRDMDARCGFGHIC